MKDILISLKNVKKKYKDKEIIKNLDLDIYKGEFLTLLGSSGCGKSTILKMISGIESVTDGSIIMEGKDITNLDSTKREINTIFQNYALFPHMTIEDNIGFGLKIKKVDKKIIQKEKENIETHSPGLFSDEEIIISEILSVDLNNITPMNALQTISRWKKTLLGQ